MLFKRLIFIGLYLLCGVALATPQKLASLDICSDYYLASFTNGENILLTRQAKDGFSLPIPIAEQSQTYRDIEQIIAYNPDLIIQSGLSFGMLPEKLQKYPYPTIPLPWATDLTGLKTIHNRLDAVLNTDIGANLNVKIDEILQNIPPKSDKNMLILAQNGFTIKRHTHYDIIFDILGLSNYHKGDGYGIIRLEEIIANPPDMIITLGANPNRPQLADSIINHNILKKLNIPIYNLGDSFTICPSMELINAAQKLKEMIP